MLGKNSNAQMRPTALGVVTQSSLYGSAIPAVFGRTRSPLNLIWANNLTKQGGSGKKGKPGGGKKGSGNTYTESVDLLIGTNPIVMPLQMWANQSDSYPLNFVSYAAHVATGGSQIISFTDSRFYCILGVTILTPYNQTFDDYGSGGPVTYEGIAETPLWNMATAGPNPTNPSAYRNWPFCFYWLPGSGPSIEVPALTLGLFDPFVLDPENIYIKIYYAQLISGKSSPIAQLRMLFEAVLGSGSEYSGHEDQQILYPPFAGLGSQNLDLGASSAMPDLRLEVLGSYPLYYSGDCDFADIVEDIFRAAQSQTGYGHVPSRTLLQRGLQCYEYPGATQKKACYSAVGNLAPMTGPQFDLGSNNSSILVVTASANSGWSSPATISDQAGHTWTPMVPDQRSAQRQLWYALAAGSTPRARNQVSLNLDGSNADIQLLEISGLEAGVFDTSAIVQSTGAIGAMTVSASVTTTNDTGKPAYILAWLFSNSPLDPTKWRPIGAMKPLITPQTNSLQRADYLIVRNPGTYDIAYELSNPVAAGQEYTLLVLVFKATAPAGYAAPIGDILDQDSLDLCRVQDRANGLWGSLSMDSQKTASEWLKDIVASMNAAPVWSGFKLKLIPRSEVSMCGNGATYIAPTAAGPVADLSTENGDFIGDPGVSPITVDIKGVPEVQNVFQLQHPNRASDYVDINESLPDSGSVANYGTRRDSPQTNRTVQESAVALKVLAIMTRRENVLRNTIKFKLSARWGLLESMDLITITDPILGFDHFPVRLNIANEGNDFQIECEAEPFIYGLNSPVEAEITDHVPYSVDKLQVPESVNPPVFIEAIGKLGDSPDQAELWIPVSDSDPVYGGCQVWCSTDGGDSYKLLGSIAGNAITGYLISEWPYGTDPDTADNLAVDITESNGLLVSQSTQDEDAGTYPCYVQGGNSFLPYELMSYAVAEQTDVSKYLLMATGGNYLHRGIKSSPIADHPAASRFAFLDPAGTGIFKYALDPSWIGKTLHFKFPAINKYGAGLQDLSDCVDYTYTPTGVWQQGSVPDDLWTAGLISASRIIFGCEARKWDVGIVRAQFRAILVPPGQSVLYEDLRTVAEGGTFVPDGVTRLQIDNLAASWEGVHYQVFYGANVGRWYYAFRLMNAAGWSVWSDGNNFPERVTDNVDTEGANFSDTGPPEDWTLSVQPGPLSGTAVVVASRPATNGKRIWFALFQIKDSSTGSWRAVDENAGAAITHYDGSAIDHTYDPVAGTIIKASGDFGAGATFGGLMLHRRAPGRVRF